MARVVHVIVFTPGPEAAVLLLRRPEARVAGWQGVTGRVEPGDGEGPLPPSLRGAPEGHDVAALARAAVREIAEETGLPPPLDLVDLALEREYVGYDGVHYRQRSFAARYEAALPVPGTPEHEEARWVSPAEARALVRWESDRAALDALTPWLAP